MFVYNIHCKLLVSTSVAYVIQSNCRSVFVSYCNEQDSTFQSAKLHFIFLVPFYFPYFTGHSSSPPRSSSHHHHHHRTRLSSTRLPNNCPTCLLLILLRTVRACALPSRHIFGRAEISRHTGISEIYSILGSG